MNWCPLFWRIPSWNLGRHIYPDQIWVDQIHIYHAIFTIYTKSTQIGRHIYHAQVWYFDFFESTSFVAKLPGRRWTSATWLGSICPVRTCIGKVSGRPPKICATLSGYMAVTHIASWMRIYGTGKPPSTGWFGTKKHGQFGVVYWQHHTTPFLCHINVYKSLSVWTMLPCSPRMHESSEEDWPFRENAFIIDMWTVFTVCIGSFYTCII